MDTKLSNPIQVDKFGLTATNQLEIWYTRNGKPYYKVISPDLLHDHLLAKHHSGGVTITECDNAVDFLKMGDSFIVKCELRDLLFKMEPEEPLTRLFEYLESTEGYNINNHHLIQ